MKPRLLDLFCGAGGAARGYQRAGFYVVGVDHKPQPRYAGDEFVQADAMQYPLVGFDAIHASPPCQAYTVLRHHAKAQGTAPTEYPDLVGQVRSRLESSGRPWVIENVVGAPLFRAVLLCGSAFGNDMLQRHRLFESNVLLLAPPCSHGIYLPRFPALRSDRKGRLARVVGVFGHGGGSAKHKLLWEQAMGIGWASKAEIAQAVPPAYTEFIGRQLLAYLERCARV